MYMYTRCNTCYMGKSGMQLTLCSTSMADPITIGRTVRGKLRMFSSARVTNAFSGVSRSLGSSRCTRT